MIKGQIEVLNLITNFVIIKFNNNNNNNTKWEILKKWQKVKLSN